MRKGMGILLVLILILTPALTGCRRTPETPSDQEVSELTSDFIGELAAENYSGAYAYFNERMKGAISEDMLGELWEQLTQQMGPYVGEAEQRDESQPPYQIVVATIQMGSTFLDVRVVFDSKKQIAGLFFQPSEYLSRYYEPPAYADPSTFSEYDVLLGSGEWVLPATLTIPAGMGPFPFVVLVHGSGPHDRNETIGPNRPFQDLAWGLVSQGIGVLRYEKRTREHGAKMADLLDTLTPDEEVVADALEAVAFLRETPEAHREQIFVLGHSLGGMLAPRIAGRTPAPLAGLVMMGATPRKLEDLIIEQVSYLLSRKEAPTPAEQEGLLKLKEQVARVKDPDLSPDTPGSELPLGMPASYWLYLNAYDIGKEARSLQIPILILQGERDYQVTMTDFQAWKTELAGQTGVTYSSYPQLNHLFMPGEGPPDPQEYMMPNHVDFQVVEEIAAWIRTQIKEEAP